MEDKGDKSKMNKGSDDRDRTGADRTVVSGVMSRLRTFARESRRANHAELPSNLVPSLHLDYADPSDPSDDHLMYGSWKNKQGTKKGSYRSDRTQGHESEVGDAQTYQTLQKNHAMDFAKPITNTGKANHKISHSGISENNNAESNSKVSDGIRNHHRTANVPDSLNAPFTISTSFITNYFFPKGMKQVKSSFVETSAEKESTQGTKHINRNETCARMRVSRLSTDYLTKDRKLNTSNTCTLDPELNTEATKPVKDVAYDDKVKSRGSTRPDGPIVKLQCNKSEITNTVETATKKLQILLERSLMMQHNKQPIHVKTITQTDCSNKKWENSDNTKSISCNRKEQECDNMKEFEHDIKFLSKCSNMTSTPDKDRVKTSSALKSQSPASFKSTPHEAAGANERLSPAKCTESKPRFQTTGPMYSPIRQVSPLAKPSIPATSPLNRHAQAVYPETRKLAEKVFVSKQSNAQAQGAYPDCPTLASVDTDLATLDVAHFKVPMLKIVKEMEKANLKDLHPVCSTPVRRCLSFSQPSVPTHQSPDKFESKISYSGAETTLEPIRRFASETEEAVYYLIKKYLNNKEPKCP